MSRRSVMAEIGSQAASLGRSDGEPGREPLSGAARHGGTLVSIVVAVGLLAGAAAAAAEGEDGREAFEAHAFVGYVIDSFAAQATKRYINPGASGDVQERWAAGFDFAFCLSGDPSNSKDSLVWIAGRTLHGIRSTDVDCAAAPDTPVCKPFGPDFQEQHLYILRNARTLEGFIALRYEFGHRSSKTSPTRPYVKAQAGFLTVAGAGDDVIDVHHVGFGLLAVGGPFKDSFVELGYGRTDVFLENRSRRWKIGAYLVWGDRGAWAKHGIRPFSAIAIDSDFGPGADSIQSYLGLAVRLDKFCLFNCPKT